MAKVKTEAKKSVSRLTKEFKDFLNTSSNASENNNTAKERQFGFLDLQHLMHTQVLFFP